MAIDLDDISARFAIRIRRRIERIAAGDLPDTTQTRLGGTKVAEMARQFVAAEVEIKPADIPTSLALFPDALRSSTIYRGTLEQTVVDALRREIAIAIFDQSILQILADQWQGYTFESVMEYLRHACGRLGHDVPSCARRGAVVSSMEEVEVLKKELRFVLSCAQDPDVGPRSIELLIQPACENIWFLDHVLEGRVPMHRPA